MQLFLGWSGHKSRLLAEFLRGWIPSVVQAVTPWMSESDIDKGAKWTAEISAQLEASNFAVVCLAGSNQSMPWINFEAGAVSKMGNARVATVCLDLRKSDVLTPLGMFQGTDLASQDDVRRLVGSINTACSDQALEADRLATAFERWWPDLEAKVEALRAIDDGEPTVHRDSNDILDEILDRVRSLDATDRATAPLWAQYIRQAGIGGPACQVICNMPFIQQTAGYNVIDLVVEGNELASWQTAALDDLCLGYRALINITGDNGTLFYRDERPSD